MNDLVKARAILASEGWLASTPACFRDAVLDRATFHRRDGSEPLYRAGDPPGGLWGLVSGGLAVELEGADQAPSFTYLMHPGSWVGEGSVITRRPRIVGVRATRASELVHLPLAAFDAIAALDPGAWRWVALLAQIHLEDLMAHAEDRSIRDGRRRVIAVLLRLARRRDPADETRWPGASSVAITQDALADLCALSRSSLSDALRGLGERGLVALGYRRIDLLDPGALRAELST